MTIILTLSHAITKPTFSDYEVQGMIRLGARIGKVLRPGAYLVDAIPILKYLPGYLTDVRGYLKEEHALFKSMMDRVRERIVRMFQCAFVHWISWGSRTKKTMRRRASLNTFWKIKSRWGCRMINSSIWRGQCLALGLRRCAYVTQYLSV